MLTEFFLALFDILAMVFDPLFSGGLATGEQYFGVFDNNGMVSF